MLWPFAWKRGSCTFLFVDHRCNRINNVRSDVSVGSGEKLWEIGAVDTQRVPP